MSTQDDARLDALIEKLLLPHERSEARWLIVALRARADEQEKKAKLWEGDARTAQSNWHAACDDIAKRDAEVLALRTALRKQVLHKMLPVYPAGAKEPTGMLCELCSESWQIKGREKHASGCLAAMKD